MQLPEAPMSGYPDTLLLVPATEHFGIVFSAGYPKLLQLFSDSALLHYLRLLIKVTITSFLEPTLDSAGFDAIKITVPLYLLLCLMVTHYSVSLSSSSHPSKPFSTSSSFSLLSRVLVTLFLSLLSQTTPQMDGEVSSSLCLWPPWNSVNYQQISVKNWDFFQVFPIYHHDSSWEQSIHHFSLSVIVFQGLL